MTDLSKGIIEIGGFNLCPTTTMDEISRFFNILPMKNCHNAFDLTKREFEICGQLFKVQNLWFNDTTDKLDYISLCPVLPDLADKYNLEAYSNDWLPYYKEIRTILDEWLEKQLGKPTYKDEDCTEYKFANILIATASYEEHKRDYYVEGGKLEIYYK